MKRMDRRDFLVTTGALGALGESLDELFGSLRNCC